MVERVLELSTGSLVGRAVSRGLWLQGLGITKLVSAHWWVGLCLGAAG